jgi:two-component system, NtrC family, sensor kinase
VLRKLAAFIDASIGRRLALGMTTMLLAGLAVSTAVFVAEERWEMQEILVQKGKTVVKIESRRLAASFNQRNPNSWGEELRPVLEDRDFVYAYVFDDNGLRSSASDAGVAGGPRTRLPHLRSLLPNRCIVRPAGDYMEIVTPVFVDGKKVAGLGLGVSLDLPSREVRRLRMRFLLVTAGLVTGSLAFMYWWTRKTVAPLLQLTRGAEQLARGDLSVRVPVERTDQVGTLASTFNNLADSLQRTLLEKDRALTETNRLYRNLKVARARLDRAERLSAVGMLAAGISHELNNPLGIILSTAGNLRESLGTDHEFLEDVTIIEGETQRCRRIIQGLLNFAASGESNPIELDVNLLLRETFTLAVRDERAQHMSAEWKLDPHLPLLWADPHQLQQVFLNLLMNAADAMEGRGVVTLRTGESIEGGRRTVLIEFGDHGCGIGPADLDHIFDPFYTTKKGGAGFGLGLAVSYGIIAAHGGEITVASELGQGSVFTITLPVRPEFAHADAAGQMR